MAWSTVSNAAERSKRTSAATSPLSTAPRMSENTRRATVSVEWFPCSGRHPTAYTVPVAVMAFKVIQGE